MDIKEYYAKETEEYRKRTPQSGEMYQKACNYIAGGETRSVSYYHPYPLTIARGSGCEIYDLDGNKYYDFINNYTSLIHGHANPQVVEAMAKAQEKGTAVPAGISEQVQLAQLLCERVPSVERVRFCNSGTEATLFAVRAAKAYTGRSGLIKVLGGYHGTTDMMEYNVSPQIDLSKPEGSLIPRPDIRGVSERIAQDMYIMHFNDLACTEEILKKDADKIAAIIVEPFLGAGGLIPAKEGYLKGLRDLADQYGVLLIFDEVQALRLSDGGAQKRYGVTPDLSAFGKIIGGGLAVGGFGGKKEIMDVFDPRTAGHLSQSGTFNGNRPTMAAGYTALSLYDQAACDRLEILAERLEKGIVDSFARHDIEGCVTRAGSLMNYHFSEIVPYDYITSLHDNKEILKLVHLGLLKRGIFVAPRGTIALSTPMTQSVIDETIHAFDETLSEIKGYI